VAKPYRQAPLIGADENTGLPVLRDRQQRIADMLSRLCADFDDEFILHVATEVGLDECISYSGKDNALDFDMTPLQMVALTSALAACKEYRDARKTTKSKRTRR